MSTLDKRFYHQIDMAVPPTKSGHLITKEYFDTALSGINPTSRFDVLEAPGQFTAGLPAMMMTAGDYTFPEFTTGDWFEMFANVDGCRLVPGAYNILPVGLGKNLVMDQGYSIRMIATSPTELDFIFISNGKMHSAPPVAQPPKSDWTVLNSISALEVNRSYVLMVSGDYTLPLMTTNDSIRIHSKVTATRLMSNGNIITRVGAGNNLVIQAGETVSLVCSAPGIVEIL